MSTCFLLSSAFFTRITLLVCWLFGALPENHTPLGVDVLAAIFVPRLLIAWWAYEAHMHPLIIAVFVLLEVMEKSSTRIRVSDPAPATRKPSRG